MKAGGFIIALGSCDPAALRNHRGLVFFVNWLAAMFALIIGPASIIARPCNLAPFQLLLAIAMRAFHAEAALVTFLISRIDPA